MRYHLLEEDPMANGTNRVNAYQPPETNDLSVVAKTLNELPTRQRQRITTELKRIHKLVSAFDEDSHRDRAIDKRES